MSARNLSQHDIMLLMNAVASTSAGPNDTVSATSAALVEVHGYDLAEADTAAKAAFEKWIEAFEGGFS